MSEISIYIHNEVQRVFTGRDYDSIGHHLAGVKYSHDIIACHLVNGIRGVIHNIRVMIHIKMLISDSKLPEVTYVQVEREVEGDPDDMQQLHCAPV